MKTVDNLTRLKSNCISNCSNRTAECNTQLITSKHSGTPEGIIISTELNVKGGGARPQISAHDLNLVNMPYGNMVEMYALEATNTNTIVDNNVSITTEDKHHLINDWICKNNTPDDELYVQPVYNDTPHYIIALYGLDSPTCFNVYTE